MSCDAYNLKNAGFPSIVSNVVDFSLHISSLLPDNLINGDTNNLSLFLQSFNLNNIMNYFSMTFIIILGTTLCFSLLSFISCGVCICCRLYTRCRRNACNRCLICCCSDVMKHEKPFTTCERLRPLFIRAFCYLIYVLLTSMIMAYMLAFSNSSMLKSSCELHDIRTNAMKMYVNGFDDVSLNYTSNYELEKEKQDETMNNINNIKSFHSAMNDIQSTFTTLDATIAINSAPLFLPNNTKFYCYLSNGISLNTVVRRSIDTIQQIKTVKNQKNQMKMGGGEVISAKDKITNMHDYLKRGVKQNTNLYDTVKYNSKIMKIKKDIVFTFISNDFKIIDESYINFSKTISSLSYYWIGLLVILPLLSCICGCFGHYMIYCGDAEDSECLSDFDVVQGMYLSSRGALHLVGCMSKMGARLNGCSWCVALMGSSMYFLFGGLLLITYGIGNDACTILPTILNDLPLYLPSNSPDNNDRLSNDYLSNSLLPKCMNSNTNEIANVLNISSLNMSQLQIVTSKTTHWSKVEQNLNVLLMDIHLISNQVNDNCFYESKIDINEKITNSKRFVDYNSSSSGGGDSMKQQSDYIVNALKSLHNTFNGTDMKIATKTLNSTIQSTNNLEKYLNVFQRAFNVSSISDNCKNTYDVLQNFEQSTCNEMVPILFWIGVFVLLLAITGIPICFTTITIQRTWGGHGKFNFFLIYLYKS